MHVYKYALKKKYVYARIHRGRGKEKDERDGQRQRQTVTDRQTGGRMDRARTRDRSNGYHLFLYITLLTCHEHHYETKCSGSFSVKYLG